LESVNGIVEDISLRMTTLRDLDGTVHHLSNGEIKSVSNMSKHFTRVNINIGVYYKTDKEKLIHVVNQVGDSLSNDPEWSDKILKKSEFLRVEDFADSAIIIKVLGEVVPLQKLAVAGQLRKRLKLAFDQEGIEIPYPQIVVHQASTS
jgi:Small-conductance mechanosensitive channel